MGNDELVTVAEALFDFDGLRADNLPFQKGDVITVLEMNESGWWRGADSSGRVGIFPYNYVELRDEVGSSFPVVRALFDFEATASGQISFQKGDSLTLLKEISVDWWSGRNKRTGEEGIFPANRVEKTDDEDVEAAKEEAKRWSRIRKEKKKEAEKAAKERASIQRRQRKQKDEEEKKKLAEEARAADERARRAEEELERVRAEAALLKRQQAERDARRSSRARKSVVTQRDAIKERARMSAVRWQGMAPGPPPELEEERMRYLNETSAAGPPAPPDDEDDLFGPAPPMEEPAPRLKGKALEEARAAEEAAAPAEEDQSAAAKASKFKYNSKFSNLGGGSRCRKCEKTVGFADRVKALGGDWHKDCFRCSTCSVVLRQGEWREHNNHPYCKKCHATGFGIKGFGFGGSVVPVDAGKLRNADAKATGEVDSRPLFSVLEDHGKSL